MPAHKYTPTPAVYDCIQYDGANFEEIVEMGAPVTRKDGKVYLFLAEVPVGGWVLKDIYGAFTTLSDAMFQVGYKPGGGP